MNVLAEDRSANPCLHEYPCSIQAYIHASMDINTDIHDSSMDLNIHVYVTDIHMDSSTWAYSKTSL